MGNAAPCVVTWLATVVVALLAGRAAEAVRLDAVFRRLWDAADNGHKCQPEQVHLAVTGDPTEMRVMWKTRSASCSTKVKYGEGAYASNDAAAFSLAATLQHPAGHTRTFSSKDMCASPARDYSYDPEVVHDVILTGLRPGGRYSYKIAHGSVVNGFQAPPPVGRKEGFTFLVYGDMGDPHHRKAKAPGAGGTARYVARDVADGADMVLHVGDISYANGDGAVWDSFMAAIEPASKRVPYMVAVGNHEYDYRWSRKRRRSDPSGSGDPYNPDWGNFGNDSGGECGVSVANRFSMPGASIEANGGLVTAAAAAFGANGTVGPGENRHHRSGAPRDNAPFWYSYEYGSVHFTVISTEHSLERGSPQYEWLKADLKAVDRCVTPWLVAAMHRPMYVVYPHKSNRIVGEHLRNELEGLFNDYAVDLVFSGHVHSYARTCNVLAERCVDMDRGGMTHITLGCGGHTLSDVSHDQEDWLEYTRVAWGYGRVTVHDGYSLTFEFVLSKACFLAEILGDPQMSCLESKNGKVEDSYTLENSRADRRHCFVRDNYRTVAVKAPAQLRTC